MSLHQCEAIKANGERCGRMAQAGERYCYSHRDRNRPKYPPCVCCGRPFDECQKATFYYSTRVTLCDSCRQRMYADGRPVRAPVGGDTT